MKLLLLIIAIFTILAVPQVYAYNSLQNTNLHGESAVVSMDIEFGKDTVKRLLSKTITENHLNNMVLELYGDKILLSETELTVTDTGNHFRILSLPEGILMYGHKNIEIENYDINLYFATNDGLEKFSLSTNIPSLKEKIIETEEPEIKKQYIPELLITSSHDFKTHWKQTFNIDVQAFDGNINSDPKSSEFEGRLDGVDVKVLLSKDDVQVATLSGVTANGEWKGGYFFEENITTPGEYIVDVVISYLGKSISKSSNMFVIGTVAGNESTNHPPISNAGFNQSVPEHDGGMIPIFTEITLDGSKSSDPDGDNISYSWLQVSGTDVTLSDKLAQQPTFEAPDITMTEDLIFELIVTDARGRVSLTSDSVTITITFVN